MTTEIQTIKAETLLTNAFTHLYSVDGYQWKILSVSNASKAFISVEVIDEMGFGYKTGSVTKRIKKSTNVTAS